MKLTIKLLSEIIFFSIPKEINQKMCRILFVITFVCFNKISSQEVKGSPKTKTVNIEFTNHQKGKTDSLVFSVFGIIGYPYIFYSPVTKLAFGAGALLFFRTEKNKNLRSSKILLSGNYTTNKQYNLVFSIEVYFPGIDKSYLCARLNFANEVGQFCTHLSGGSPPFYRLPALGSGNRMRGNFKGRYRDRQYFITQVNTGKLYGGDLE